MPILDAHQPFHHDGDRVGVLFCHGFTSNPSSLIEWARHVAEAGHTVALPRLPGHGTIWQELAVTRWQDWYECVDAEYGRLAERCDEVFVAGLSMGGALALRLAAHHADVRGLVLVNPALSTVDRTAYLAGVLHRVLPSVKAVGGDIRREGVEEGAYDRTPVAAVAQLMRLFVDVKATLDLVTCPIDLYRSAVDHVVPGSSSDTVRRLVSSVDLTETVLHDSYHVATMDNDRQTIFDGSLAFLDRVLAAEPRPEPSA